MDKDKQMAFLFEEGGMADDGLDRDPVSGNEVPSGSMSEEVRDDIPAQLSEGEYVVPADVVRYYGVKFFEDLREDAKEGLTGMEEEGRIGGEPIDYEEDDTDLSEEEMAELESIMGMAVGGYVEPTQQVMGSIPAEQQMTLAFQEGGDVPPASQVPVDFSGFGPGFSFMGDNPGQNLPTVPTSRNVTLYGPNGEVVSLILPSQQSDYDNYISQGYSETPSAVPTTPVVEEQQQDDNGSEMTPQEYQRSLDRSFTGSSTFSRDDIAGIQSDPFAFINTELSRSTTGARVGGAIAGLIGGPLIGGGIAVAGELEPIARSRAALEIARASGNYTTEQLTAAQNSINQRIEGMPLAARMALNAGFASGKRYAREGQSAIDKISGIAAYDASANRPSYLGTRSGMDTLNSVMTAAGELTGPAAQSYADSAESGYTGTGPRGIAVGNISGVNGVEGVVVGENGRAIKTTDGKTVFRDTEGRTYVRTGLLGRGVEYRDVPNVPQSNVPPPENTQGVDTGNSDNEKGEGSVICTALFKKGLLSKEIYALDTQYGLMLDLNQPEVTRGYRKLASPLANYIQKDTLGATVARTLIAPLAKAWANEMAHQMQPEKYEGNVVGKAIMALGYPVCAFVGKRTKEIIYGT
jgi:hypothetical protein